MADSLIDLENFADYTIAETYYANGDWSSGYPNNMKCWGASNSKWRHMLWDLDFGLGLYGTPTNADYITEARNNDFHFDRLCNALLNNETFRIYFINRYADLINTIFQPDNFTAIGYAMRAELEPAINRHHQRWGGDYNSFYYGMENMLNWNLARISGARNVIQNHFALPAQVEINLDVFPANAGRVHISTIEPEENEYPWSGVYFKGVPVRITAIANPGFQFSHWNANELFPDQVFSADTTLFFDVNTHFTAVFTGSVAEQSLQISELMYYPDSSQTCGDWIELFNPLNVPLDLSGIYLKDSDYFHRYDFPFNTQLPPGAFLVLASDTASFSQYYPDVQHVYGPLDFGFSNAGETLTLFNHSQDTIAKAFYANNPNWHLGVNGCGRTLESVVPGEALIVPEQWFSGCVDGSPGNPFANCNNALIVSEINYNSDNIADAGDWFELLNQGTETLDLSNYKVSDGNSEFLFTIPENTLLEPGNYLVIMANQSLFSTQFPFVENVIGSLPFGLSSDGDCIKIYDQDANLVQSVEYGILNPWPTEANGFGKTLELLDSEANLCDGNNWFAGCDGGSPGMAYDPDCPDLSITIDETIDNNNFYIYPNPARTILNVGNVSENVAYTIYSAQGRIVQSGSVVNATNFINIDQLSSGYYIFEIIQNGDSQKTSFLIE
jgi:hypothetical protein